MLEVTDVPRDHIRLGIYNESHLYIVIIGPTPGGTATVDAMTAQSYDAPWDHPGATYCSVLYEHTIDPLSFFVPIKRYLK